MLQRRCHNRLNQLVIIQSIYLCCYAKKMSAALTLIVEDELKKIVNGDRKFKQKNKHSGIIPQNQESPLGDFPRADSQRSKKSVLVIQPRKMRQSGVGIPPAGTRIRERLPIRSTDFRNFYIRGDLPVQIIHGSANKLGWKVDVTSIDYFHFLPLFFAGLREKEDPYRFIAVQGSYDLINRGSLNRLLPVIPQLIAPIKAALNTRDPEIVATVCKVLQALILAGNGSTKIGEALVPFYRQILPTFNIFKHSFSNIGDKIDFKQRKRLCLGELIDETLTLLEVKGGENAPANIKYMIPTYELLNSISEK